MSSQQPIELISFNLCPFVQRSVITLNKKGIDYKITYIDLADKPDWFLALSPLGKVPVLKHGDEVLFESAVINEYLDEITPQQITEAFSGGFVIFLGIFSVIWGAKHCILHFLR